MSDGGLPRGVVTFVFTDIEGSTRLLARIGDAYVDVLRDHNAIVHGAITAEGGVVVRTDGDGVFAAFSEATRALQACLDLQRGLAAHRWPAGEEVRVRAGVHTGPAAVIDGDYVGLAVHQAARIGGSGHGGQTVVSDATRAAAEDALPSDAALVELGPYRLKDFDDPQLLYQLTHPDIVATFPALLVPAVEAHNLPIARTAFIGREQELAEVAKLLERSHLVTLLGPGGVGKTRLSLEIAAGARVDFRDGVWLVGLADVGPGEAAGALAAITGVREQPDRSLVDSLADRLAGWRALFVLDNCEHVADECATLAARLLAACPDVVLLATSRRALGIRGETEYRLRPLAVPKEPLPVEALLDFDAIRLFVDRAALTTPDFSLNPANAPGVSEVCRRLDGLPLAVELAAARCGTLAARDIASHLDDRFGLLATKDPTVDARQQALHATIAWSYDLLDEHERAVLRALAAFRGGASLAALEAVAPATSESGSPLVECLKALDSHSLVQVDIDDDTARYSLLETIRAFAETMTPSAEAKELAARHRHWFAGLAREAGPALRGPDQRTWMTRLELEHDNVREALRSSLTDEPSLAVEIVGNLGAFWDIRTHHTAEGRRWVEAALAAAPEEVTEARARALSTAGTLSMSNSDYAAARGWYLESLRIATALGHPRHQASALNGLGTVCVFSAQYAEARQWLEQTIGLFRELGDQLGIGAALGNLANAALYEGDEARARSYYEESLAAFRAGGDVRGVGISLLNLGSLEHQMGDDAAARRDLEASLEVAREVQDAQIEMHAFLNLGPVARELGDPAGSVEHFTDALHVARRINNQRGVCLALLALASAPGADRHEARRQLHEALAIGRAIVDRHVMATAFIHLARIERLDGFIDGALARVREALTIARDAGEKPTIELAFGELARIAAATGDPVTAATLAGAAGASATAAVDPVDDDAALQAIRASDDDELLAARARGLALPVGDLVEWALRWRPDMSGESPAADAPADPPH